MAFKSVMGESIKDEDSIIHLIFQQTFAYLLSEKWVRLSLLEERQS